MSGRIEENRQQKKMSAGKKKLQSSIQECISKMIRNPKAPTIQNSLLCSRNWMLSACRIPKTHSFAIGRSNVHNQPQQPYNVTSHNKSSSEAATLSDVDRFLLENFRSLYIRDHDDEDEDHGRKKVDNKEGEEAPSGFLFDSPRFLNPPPDLCGSDRFFVAPRSSGSLMDEARASLTTTSEDMGTSSLTSSNNTTNDSINSSSRDNVSKEDQVSLPDDSVAVLKYSSSPYSDFRLSMQEMVDARVQDVGKVDWEFMEEMLVCYLNLNEKKTHKFVLNAFADLIVGMRQDSDNVPATELLLSSCKRRKRRLRKKMMK